MFTRVGWVPARYFEGPLFRYLANYTDIFCSTLLCKSYTNACAVCQIIQQNHLELLTKVVIGNANVLKMN